MAAVWFSLWVQLFCQKSRAALLIYFPFSCMHPWIWSAEPFLMTRAKPYFLGRKYSLFFFVSENEWLENTPKPFVTFSLWIFFYLCNKGNLFLIGSKGKIQGSICIIFLPTAKISNLNHKPLKIVRKKGSLITLKLVLRLTIRTLSVKATCQLHWLSNNKQ